jgi:hypothetical protein
MAATNYTSFCDLTEFMNFINPMPKIASAPLFEYDCRRSWDTGLSGDFFGAPSYEKAVNLFEHGWLDGSSRVMQMRASLDSVVQSAQAKKASAMGWSTGGEWLHIGRAISGRPDCFARTMSTGFDVCDRVVTVAMNASCSGSVSSKEVFMRGAVTLCLVDVLETLGHRVELLYGTCATRCDGPKIVDEFNCVAKKPGEHIGFID